MKLINPTTITDAMLVSSSVAENDYPEWSAATAYTVGQRVTRPALHKNFERTVAGTTATAPEGDPANWLDLGPTNRWAMFDQKVGTKTTATTTCAVVLSPGMVSGISLIGAEAASVTVVMTDPAYGELYNRTFDLVDYTGITNWWAYHFSPRRRKTTLVIDRLPTSRNPQISITLNGSEGATVSVGSLVVGRLAEYAKSILVGAAVGIQDYSRKERDAFGNFVVIERAFNKRARWSFVLENIDVDRLNFDLASLRATPAVYIGHDGFDATVLYGFFRSFDIVIPYPTHAECVIELEGVI